MRLEDSDIYGDTSPNFLSRLFSPVLVVSYLVASAVTGVIFFNALMLQPTDLSSPLVLSESSPAPTPTPDIVSSVTPISRPDFSVSSDITDLVSSSVPLPSSSPTVSSDTVREIQTELSSRGYYSGVLDGEFGDGTRDAIIAFERSQGLPEVGVASDALLGRLLLASSSGSVPRLVDTSSSVAIPRARVSSASDITTTSSSLPVADSDLVARIQLGLRNYGYDDVEVDGHPGIRTRTAIQRFELEYGMTITGEPTPAVLKKLREIGAYTQG